MIELKKEDTMEGRYDSLRDLSSMSRYQSWLRRTIMPPLAIKIGRAPWADAEDLPDYQAWVEITRRLATARAASIDLRYYMTRGLIVEVLFAAGGLEREIMSLRETLDVARAHADALLKKSPLQPGVPSPNLVLHSALHASYAFINALTWARSVKERVKRSDRGKEAGVLPSLKDGQLKNRILAALQKMDPYFEEARYLTNYALHAGALQGPSTPSFNVRGNGQVILSIPDAPKGRIFTWNEFRNEEDRDALTYLESLFERIAEFVEEMLNSFEALPDPL